MTGAKGPMWQTRWPRFRGCKRLLAGCAMMSAFAHAAPTFNLQDPLAFFTSTADPMLRSSTAQWCAQNFAGYTNTFGTLTTNAFSLTNIPVFINGVFVYSPAVNRLLQLAANVFDATTDSPYPSVFRPLFSKDTNGNVFITGYTNIVPFTDGSGNLQLSPPFDVTTIAALPGVISNAPDNIYGVPWIIGAKKGLPNFNEFSMVNNLAIQRRLQFTRTATNSLYSVDFSTFATNQMYLMNLSSSIGVELWNSYSNNYLGTVVVGLSEKASLTITNDDPGFNSHPLGTTTIFPIGYSTNIVFATNFWPGSGVYWTASSANPNPNSFVLPLNVTMIMLTNSVYRSPYAGPLALAGLTAPCLIPTNYFGSIGGWPVLFESPSPNGFHFPQFGLLLTNHLRVFMLDLDTNGVYRVIDYVQFAGPNSSLIVNSNLADGSSTNNNFDNNNQGVWNTNNYLNVSPAGLTYGIYNQFITSKGGFAPPGEDGKWQSDPDARTLGATIPAQANTFTAFFKPGNKYNNYVNTLLSEVAPYSPTRSVVQYITWQANDPMVHYLASDVDFGSSPNFLTTPAPGVNHYNADTLMSALTNLNLGSLNDHYLPWGGNPHIQSMGQTIQSDPNLYNLAERDPLMTQSDNWDFPTNPFSTFNWIGRVHRGTPWQTVYLKAGDILASNNVAVWTNWTGNANAMDASNEAPAQDWHLASLLTSLLNTNPVQQTASVNNPDPNAWLVLLDGLTAWTNSGSTGLYPVLISSNSPQAAVIANAIQATRAGFPGQIFGDVGDILATQQLTEQSPFLDWTDSLQQQSGISDEAYEIIPSQLLSLLRADSSGSVTLSNGQAIVNFTGGDGRAYALQSSSNLVDWFNVSTNNPVNGTFSSTNSPGGVSQFYRTLLLQ